MIPSYRQVAAKLLWSQLQEAHESSRWIHTSRAALSPEDLGVRPQVMGAMVRMGFVEAHKWHEGTHYTLTERGLIALLAGTTG